MWEQVWPLLDEASEIALRVRLDQAPADALLDELDDLAARLYRAGRTADLLVVRRRVVELTRSMVAQPVPWRSRPSTCHTMTSSGCMRGRRVHAPQVGP